MNAFTRLLSISSSTQLADEIVSAKIVLPWVFLAMGAPVWMISLLVPLKESGAILPQWHIKQLLSRLSSTALVWRLGMLKQGGALLLLCLALWWQSPYLGLVSVLGLSIGRAMCSFTVKDIQAHNVEKGRRGQLIGLGGSIAGLITIGTSFLLLWANVSDTPKLTLLYSLLGAGVLCYVLGLIMSSRLSMPTAPKQQTRHSIKQFLTEHNVLQRMIMQRILVLHGALVLPYMVLQMASIDGLSMPWFMLAGAVAGFLSSSIWGRFSDTSAQRTMVYSLIVCLIGVIGFVMSVTISLTSSSVIVAALWFFIVNLGYAGVRTARKTYLIDISHDQQRQHFVAAGNTVVGLGLLALGVTYAALYSVIEHAIIPWCGLMLLVGVVYSRTMPLEK